MEGKIQQERDLKKKRNSLFYPHQVLNKLLLVHQQRVCVCRLTDFLNDLEPSEKHQTSKCVRNHHKPKNVWKLTLLAGLGLFSLLYTCNLYVSWLPHREDQSDKTSQKNLNSVAWSCWYNTVSRRSNSTVHFWGKIENNHDRICSVKWRLTVCKPWPVFNVFTFSKHVNSYYCQPILVTDTASNLLDGDASHSCARLVLVAIVSLDK